MISFVRLNTRGFYAYVIRICVKDVSKEHAWIMEEPGKLLLKFYWFCNGRWLFLAFCRSYCLVVINWLNLDVHNYLEDFTYYYVIVTYLRQVRNIIDTRYFKCVFYSHCLRLGLISFFLLSYFSGVPDFTPVF